MSEKTALSINHGWLPCVFSAICLSVGSNVLADTVNISAAAWGTAQDDGRDGSFETIIDPDGIFLERQAFVNHVTRGIWEFDLSELPVGTITGIDLQVVVASTTLERTPFDLYGFAGNGIIEPSDAVGGTSIASGLNGALGSRFVDVLGFIQSSAVQTAGFAGFYARYPVETGGSILKAFQDPGPAGNASPRLIVEFQPVPIPAAVWLFGSGLLALIGIARRNKQ